MILCKCLFQKGKLKDLFYISELDYRSATEIVVSNHYLKRKAPCSEAFGLFCKKCKKAAGVVIYGVSCSSTLLKGVCGPDEAGNVYELTRLWIKEGTPKNAESFLIGNTLKNLKRDIIVSFSEIQQGHVGYVYQASNFLYCGLSAKFKDPKVKGLEHQHHATYANGLTMQEVKNKYGAENVYYVDRPRKHRYVFIKGPRKAELLKKLKYSVLPYPKLSTPTK